jgi:hypothetical protein
MFSKQGLYYADWRDKSGRRLRKSFSSKSAALQFEADQKEQVHPKTKARGQASPKCSAPVSTGAPTAANPRRSALSSRLQVVSNRRSSARRTSPKLSRG